MSTASGRKRPSDQSSADSSKRPANDDPPPAPNVLARQDLFGSGGVVDNVDYTCYEDDDEETVYTLTITNLLTSTTYDQIVAIYMFIVGFLVDRTYIHEPAAKAYIGFDSESSYNEGKLVANPYGQPWDPPGYNPTDKHGLFWRLLVSCDRISSFTIAQIVSVFGRSDIAVSSATINHAKKCATVYFCNEESWLKAMRIEIIPQTINGQSLPLRVVISYATTSDPAWHKIFVAELPGTSPATLRKLLVKRFGVDPEVFALLRSGKTGRVFNCGFIITKNIAIADRLLNLDEAACQLRSKIVVFRRDKTLNRRWNPNLS
jgi:hypothetical protein